MTYRVEMTRSAERDLNALPRAADRIRARIVGLAEDPRPRGSIKIGPPNRRRLRIGDYRAIYDVDDRAQLVVIREAGHRKDIYR